MIKAPEVIRHEAYSQTADVFSFAIVLWQLVTRELPYEKKSTFEAAAAVAMESLRPPFPEGIPEAYKQLVVDCWQDDPVKRPSFEDVANSLMDMDTNYTEEDKAWFEAPLGHPAYRKVHIPKAKEVAPKLKSPEMQSPDCEDAKHRKGKGQKPFLKGLFARKSSNF
jgi:mitogen-activated protein kinase kinase kinase 11